LAGRGHRINWISVRSRRTWICFTLSWLTHWRPWALLFKGKSGA